MKKYFLLGIVVLMNTLCIMAQDIIFRSSTDSIQAQVLTVGISEITYRKWNNLEGPIYSIFIDDIAAIRYANGTYDFFTTRSPQQTIVKNYNQKSSIMLTRSGNKYIYGNKIMNKTEMLDWLYSQNCSIAYEQFLDGRNLAAGGWIMMALGLGLDLGGTIMYFAGIQVGGSVLMGLGGALEIACIPTIAVGYSKMHQTVEVYNATCNKSTQTKPYWSLQASNNGIGIAYNF